MARSRLTDFLGVSKFHVLDVSFEFPLVLIPIFGFRNVRLPTLSLELKEFQQGNYEYKNKVMHKASVSNIILEQGVSLFNSDFYNWANNSITGETTPRTLVIVQFTNINPKLLASQKSSGLAKGASFIATGISGVLGGFQFSDGVRLPGRAWVCHQCRPVSYRPGTDFDAMSSEISIARLEVAMEYFEELSLGF